MVDNSLPGAQVNLDDHFDLVRKFFLNLNLDSSQQEGAKDLMETIDNEQLFFLIKLKSLFLIVLDLRIGQRMHLAQWLIKPLLELLTRTEDLRQQEVQECP